MLALVTPLVDHGVVSTWFLPASCRILAALFALSGCGRVGFGPVDDAGLLAGSDGDAVPTDSVDPNADADPACIAGAFSVTSSESDSTAPVAAWNGTKVGVVWNEQTASPPPLLYRTAMLDGTLDPEASIDDGSSYAIAADGSAFRIAFAAFTDIFWSSNGGAPQAVTSDPRDDFGPRVAVMSGGATGLTWQHRNTDGSVEVRAGVVDSAGFKVGGDTTIVVYPSAFVGSHALAWNGTELAVFYRLSNAFYMQRLDTAAAPIDGPITILPEPVGAMAAAWIGDRYVLAWNGFSEIVVAYVSSGGSLLSVTRTPSESAFELFLAAGATSDLVSWRNLSRSLVMTVARDGAAGPVMSLDYGHAFPVWVGTTFALAVSRGTAPREIELLTLCP